MILRRLIILATLLSGLAVSGCATVVGVIYAVYALLEPHVGTSGAAAIMFGVVAIILGGGAGFLFTLTRPKKIVIETVTPSPTANIADTLARTVRERPVMVILAAVGAGVLAVRNPRYLASALRAFITPRVLED